MDAQKKQKIMIAVLAVGVLGAGGVYAVRTFTSSSSEQGLRDGGSGPVQRKERADTGKKLERGRKARKTRGKATASKGTERKERKKTTRKGSTRRGKTRSKAKRLKKQDMKPMG